MAIESLNSALKLSHSYGGKEFTVYIDSDEFLSALRSAALLDEVPQSFKERKSFDHECEISLSNDQYRARVHAARCFEGKAYSVVIRDTRDDSDLTDWQREINKRRYSRSLEDIKNDLPKPDPRLMHEILHNALPQGRASDASGLILIAGATGVGKTTCLNALLRFHVVELWREGRQGSPHIVVIGDPVETMFLNETLEEARQSLIKEPSKTTVNFTPRLIGTDVDSVQAALEDARRETPAAVVVSELRRKEDFVAVLDFAASGHLIFTTSHNHSLVDAFNKLLEIEDATQAGDAPGRSRLVHRLRAVIHLSRLTPRQGEEKGTLVPALWRSTASGKSNFVSEGLSSIIPSSPRSRDTERAVLGRHWLLNKMYQKQVEDLQEAMSLDLHRR